MSHLTVVLCLVVVFGVSIVQSNKCDDKIKKDGWDSKCFDTNGGLVNYRRCDNLLTDDSCPAGKTCCVQCHKQDKKCNKKYSGSQARNNYNKDSISNCCLGEMKVGEVRPGSGCSCCKVCNKRKPKCKRNDGICFTDEDPINNWKLCESTGRTIKLEKGCTGWGCHCCIAP